MIKKIKGLLKMDEEKNDGELIIQGNEKREYPRVPMKVAVKYRILESEEAEKALTKYFDADRLLADSKKSETIDVSRSGLLMYVDDEVPIKSFIVVNMYISVPGISCSCKAIAQVVRRIKNEDTDSKFNYKIAVKFLKILHHNLKNYKFLNLEQLLDIKDRFSQGE